MREIGSAVGMETPGKKRLRCDAAKSPGDIRQYFAKRACGPDRSAIRPASAQCAQERPLLTVSTPLPCTTPAGKRTVRRPSPPPGFRHCHLRRLARCGGSKAAGEIVFGNAYCEHCLRGDRDEEMLLCDGCQRGYHMFCLTPILVIVPNDDWFCPECKSEIDDSDASVEQLRDQLLASQRTILDFFSIAKPLPGEVAPQKRKRRIGGGTPTVASVSRPSRQTFRLPRPSRSAEQRAWQLATLASAMQRKGIRFSNDLVYTEACPESANTPLLEPQPMQAMSQANAKIFSEFKQMWAQGLMPPVHVEQDLVQGYVVVADAPIEDRTLLSEYVGQVDFLANRECDSCDSIMDLLRTGDPSSSLVIVPDRVGNLARYISGINNADAAAAKKINVRSARFTVGGRVRVVLYAARRILAGERLHYDYNALDKAGYPTHHFR